MEVSSDDFIRLHRKERDLTKHIVLVQKERVRKTRGGNKINFEIIKGNLLWLVKKR